MDSSAGKIDDTPLLSGSASGGTGTVESASCMSCGQRNLGDLSLVGGWIPHLSVEDL